MTEGGGTDFRIKSWPGFQIRANCVYNKECQDFKSWHSSYSPGTLGRFRFLAFCGFGSGVFLQQLVLDVAGNRLIVCELHGEGRGA